MEAAVGERAAEPFVEEQKEQRDLNPFGGEPVGVAGAVTLQQTVAFELAQVVAELVEAVGGVGEVEGGEDGAVDLRRNDRKPLAGSRFYCKLTATRARGANGLM